MNRVCLLYLIGVTDRTVKTRTSNGADKVHTVSGIIWLIEKSVGKWNGNRKTGGMKL